MDDVIKMSIALPTDDRGLTGRECPSPDCLGYFKIQFGTGLQGEGLPCHCPYCGHTAGQDNFFTQDQIKYATSVAGRQVLDQVVRELKTMEFSYQPRGPFGIGLSLRIEGRPEPIYRYGEMELETEVVCEKCTLRYAIYGVFAYCPDCATHNSLQILNKNLDLAEKKIALAETQSDRVIAENIVADALQNTVATFDAFGRELCRVHAESSSEPKRARKISFQSLGRARKHVSKCFGLDITEGLEPREWELIAKKFQKRHLLAHKMGVVDEEYLKVAGDPEAVVGRKVRIRPDQVLEHIAALRKLGRLLEEQLSRASPKSEAGNEDAESGRMTT